MKKQALACLGVAALVLSVGGCGQTRKDAWRQSGQSWKESGKQLGQALGKSVEGDHPKREWKELGSDLKDAGKDTGRALGKTIEPDPD